MIFTFWAKLILRDKRKKTTKAGHSLLLWGIVTIFGPWCALVEQRIHRIQHGGQSWPNDPTCWKGEFIFLLNKTITTSWAKVQFSLSFLTERFDLQPQKYLKNYSWKFSIRICCLYDRRAITQNLQRTLFWFEHNRE